MSFLILNAGSTDIVESSTPPKYQDPHKLALLQKSTLEQLRDDFVQEDFIPTCTYFANTAESCS